MNNHAIKERKGKGTYQRGDLFRNTSRIKKEKINEKINNPHVNPSFTNTPTEHIKKYHLRTFKKTLR